MCGENHTFLFYSLGGCHISNVIQGFLPALCSGIIPENAGNHRIPGIKLGSPAFKTALSLISIHTV